jgi:hypothetical protein
MALIDWCPGPRWLSANGPDHVHPLAATVEEPAAEEPDAAEQANKASPTTTPVIRLRDPINAMRLTGVSAVIRPVSCRSPER